MMVINISEELHNFSKGLLQCYYFCDKNPLRCLNVTVERLI